MRVGQIASATDTGRKRRRNEDAFVVRPPLFAVADGMGGAQAGEIASRLVAEALRESGAGEAAEERVEELVQEANRRVYRRAHEDAAASGMGTTVTVALVGDEEVVLGHVGDSRAYRFRGGRLEQLTADHNLVQELVRDGKLTPEEAEAHPQRSVITRAVGTDPDVDVDIERVVAEAGDLFLLCSDGLTDMVADADIERIVAASDGDLEHAANELVAFANRRGGVDNITVVLFELADDEPTATLPQAAAPAEEPADEEDEDTLTELDGIPTLEPPPAATEERRRGRRILLLAGAVLLLAALAAAVLYVLGYLS